MLFLWCCRPLLFLLNCKSSTSDWSRTFYGCVHGLSFSFYYRTTRLTSRATQSIVRRNCPLCRQYFWNILLQRQPFSLLRCFPLGADSFVRHFFVGWRSSVFPFSLSKTLRSLIPYLRLSSTFFSTLKVANARDNTSAFFLAAAAILHSTLG